MSKKNVWCSINVPLVMEVNEPDDNSATLKVEHMFERGELQSEILRSVIDGDITLEIDEVEDVED